MVLREKLYTVDEFLALMQQPEYADRHFELREGVIVNVLSARRKDTFLAMWIGSVITPFVLEHNLGFVSGADGGYKINEWNYFEPDFGFITHERTGGLEGVEFDVAPDLAVEVISPSETSSAVLAKARGYLQAGAKVVWAVYPEDRTVIEYRLAASGKIEVESYSVDDTLTAEDVLPGFTLEVREIFKVLD
jgi:Uma2 family endonuclease